MFSDPETLSNDAPSKGVQIVLIQIFTSCIHTKVSIYTCMQGLDSGEKRHKITVALTPDNKLRNRFKNISVCKYIHTCTDKTELVEYIYIECMHLP